MREGKQHVFDDFYAAAERLIADGWTTPRQLAISGGSNGGLLVGAAITQRPELYAAAICSAPLLDMVRYERFGLGETWNDEYGTASDPEQLGWLLSYSPYHHVRDGTSYPAVLFTVFDSDTRVDPMHARKMCAALQHATAATPGPPRARRRRSAARGRRAWFAGQGAGRPASPAGPAAARGIGRARGPGRQPFGIAGRRHPRVRGLSHRPPRLGALSARPGRGRPRQRLGTERLQNGQWAARRTADALVSVRAAIVRR